MQRFEKGDLVLTSYYMPRSGGARPTVMLVVGSWPVGSHGFDYWLCAVTLDPADDPYEIPLNVADMESGSISETFWIHPTYTGAVAQGSISRYLGRITRAKLDEVIEAMKDVLAED